MWRRVIVDATIEHPVERVFPYLADPTSWPEFVPAVVLRRPTSEGPVAVGYTWEAIDRIGPFKIRFVDELEAIDAGRRVVWRSSAPWNARVEYVCTGEGPRTRVRATYEGDVGGWLRLLAWVPGPIVGWILAKDFQRLDALLTSAG